MPITALCRFCDQERKLIKAHIIPEGFFRRLSEIGGTNRLLDLRGFPKKSRVGLYDERILCASCDQIFGNWDNYAQSVLGRELKNSQPIFASGELGGYECPEYDYPSLKLFFISLLWRAAISTHPFFERISLGPFEARAKDMLKRQDPGGVQQFGVVLAKFDEDIGEAVFDPARIRINNLNFCQLYLGGYVAYIKVDSRNIGYPWSHLLLDQSQPLRVVLRHLLRSPEAEIMRDIINAPQNQLRDVNHK